MSNVVFALLIVWGIPGLMFLVLYGLDWLVGELHQRRARRRSLWY